MDEIAEAAGVARQTVFSAYGSKARLLKEVVDVRLAGDDEPLSIAERPAAQRMLASTDPVDAIRARPSSSSRPASAWCRCGRRSAPRPPPTPRWATWCASTRRAPRGHRHDRRRRRRPGRPAQGPQQGEGQGRGVAPHQPVHRLRRPHAGLDAERAGALVHRLPDGAAAGAAGRPLTAGRGRGMTRRRSSAIGANRRSPMPSRTSTVA